MKWEAFTDRALGLLERSLYWGSRRQEVIAGNVANLDTPQATSKELDFRQVLSRHLEGGNPRPLTLTHLAHLGRGEPGLDGLVHDTGEEGDLDREMARMAENQLMYQASVQMLLKKLESLRAALDGDKR